MIPKGFQVLSERRAQSVEHAVDLFDAIILGFVYASKSTPESAAKSAPESEALLYQWQILLISPSCIESIYRH